MDLRQLRSFVAVARERQFVRAAASLHLAQSALSQQIRRLERDLGADLFVRDRRGVMLTPAGQRLLPHALALLAAADDARADVERMRGTLTGRLRIGAGSRVATIPFAETLAAFCEANPSVAIAVRDDASRELLRLLLEAQLDAVLVSQAADTLPSGAAGRDLAVEPFVAILPASHSVASQEVVRLDQLSTATLVTMPPGSSVRAVLERAFAQDGVPTPPASAEVMDPALVVELVAHGVGIAIVPRSFAEGAGSRVVVRPVDASSLRRTITLAWSTRRRHAPLLEAFLAFATPRLTQPR